MCNLIFMDVILRALVIIVFFNFSMFFLVFKRNIYPHFTIGLIISLIASIIFLFEGFQLFDGASELIRLPLCLLVIGIWGISFYFYYFHFIYDFSFSLYRWHRIGVICLIVLNIIVSLGGLFLIIPDSISLLATGLTTTVLGTFTFSLPMFLTLKSQLQEKSSKKIILSICTSSLALGNLTFLFMNNYAFALEIIIVSLVILSLYMILDRDHEEKPRGNFLSSKTIFSTSSNL